MNTKFDELTKQMAQSVTRRAALKKFGVGLAGMALACFGLANRAQAAKTKCYTNADCGQGQVCFFGSCTDCRQSGMGCLHGTQCCSGICIYTFTHGYFCK